MINLALVGAGTWGSNYLHAITAVPSARISAVYTHNYRQLITEPKIDGIIIATPSETHYEIARFFLEKNYNLLVEKPLTIKYLQAKKLEEIYKKSKSIVHVGHIYLQNSSFKDFTSRVKLLRDLRYLIFQSGKFGPFRSKTSALWDWGPHDISMCLALMDKDPDAVASWGNVMSKNADVIMGKLDFSNNISAFFTTGRLIPEKTRRVIAVGNQNHIIFDDIHSKDKKDQPLQNQIRFFVEAIENHKRTDENFLMGVRVVKILHYLEQSLIHNGKTIKVTS